MAKPGSTGSMPSGEMGTKAPTGAMARSAMGGPVPASDTERVLVEMRISTTQPTAYALQTAATLQGFQVDTGYAPVPVSPHPDQAARFAAAGEQVVIVRGTVATDQRANLERHPNVIRVWSDTRIAPFATMQMRTMEPISAFVAPTQGAASCPIGTCDCSPGTAKGTIADVAGYLGVDQIWNIGLRGTGIVVGIVDGGITAVGRPIRAGEQNTPQVPRVIGGWPVADWGTTAAAWGNHANMTSTDALGMAPEAQIYDIRISDGDAISNALAGFQWAIDQHRVDGTPQVLSNSWGIFQENWDRDYATNPNHPFTRKVVEALDEGILVLFAAGNCGATCPDGRCGSDIGPGRDIWVPMVTRVLSLSVRLILTNSLSATVVKVRPH